MTNHELQIIALTLTARADRANGETAQELRSIIDALSNLLPEFAAALPKDEVPEADFRIARPYRTIPVPVAKGGYHFDGLSSHRGPCVCCGRDVKSEKYSVIMGDGGGSLIHPEDEQIAREHDLDYMGCMPIGPECRKLIPAEYLV